MVENRFFKKFGIPLIMSLMMFSIHAQVTSVDYQLRYDESSEFYEAYMIVNSGNATTTINRFQISAQYSIVVPTGTNLTIEKNHMPLALNHDYSGTIPCIWAVSYTIMSPSSQPESDFYAIVPNLIPNCHYNNLNTNDSIKLFSFSVTNNTNCVSPIRIFDNEDQFLIQEADLSNAMTLGGNFSDLYRENLAPFNIPTENNLPIISIIGETDIFINETTNLSPTSGGTWTSNNLNVASIDNTGEVTGISTGNVTFTFTDNNSGCASTSEVITVFEPNNTIETSKENHYLIAPNPIVNQLYLSTSSSSNKPIIINIYDVNGSKVFNSQHSLKEGKSNIPIDLDGYPKGLYILHILSGSNNIEILRFVKE